MARADEPAAHGPVVNNLCCGLGYFWPIWDSHKQTFADKIMSTYVISATTPPPRVY